MSEIAACESKGELVKRVPILLDCGRVIEIGDRFPGVVLRSVILPLDQIFALAFLATMIQNLLYVERLVVIGGIRRRRNEFQVITRRLTGHDVTSRVYE